MKCENAITRGLGISLSPQCYDNEAKKSYTVTYDPTQFEQDTMNLCDECAKFLKKDCRKYGYYIKSGKLKE